jgi:RNA polymerase sigma factor, sigma-70 family
LERAEPLQTAGSRPGSLEHRTVILSTAQSTLQCKNFEMSVEHQTAAPVFDSLTRQHKDSVYRQMLRVCGNRQDAEDVLIEALLKAYRHLDQLRDSSAFRAWLAQIARRVCWQLKEQEALLPLLQLSMLEAEGREIPGGELTPEAQFARGQMKQLLDDAVAVLPSLYQSVYKLRDIENRPGDQVAKKLGISGAAMKSRLHRARELIGLHLDAALLRESSRWVFHLGGLYGNYSRTSGGGTV